jgi:hypothetical protein
MSVLCKSVAAPLTSPQVASIVGGMRCLVLVLSLAACAPEPARTEVPAPSAAPQVAATPAETPGAAVPAASAAPSANAPVSAGSAENDPRWHAMVREIAAGYAQWGRVDDEMRWAPGLCRMPMPARARISASGDESTHGRKLYTLYAKDPVAYGAAQSAYPGPEQPGLKDISQVIVKEAFRPVETKDRGIGLGGELQPAQHEGKLYAPGEALGIYMLFKPNRPVAETDAGWVYATVAADLKTVTSAGKVASCMGCHQQIAGGGRLFGLKDQQELPPGPGPDGRHRVNAPPR